PPPSNATPGHFLASFRAIVPPPATHTRAQANARDCFQPQAHGIHEAGPNTEMIQLGRRLCLYLRPPHANSCNPGVPLQDVRGTLREPLIKAIPPCGGLKSQEEAHHPPNTHTEQSTALWLQKFGLLQQHLTCEYRTLLRNGKE
ncbi:hypothetical protein DQ04_15241000, partial [Trypanosoma grayi]|uniref:hypothetical protein n=1 Tax=Trypanosoma grayi TaxID=71804 RepID=UPI0004F41846